ncbi:MAG: uridine kinase [Crocinitomicaceae bacterium]|nr:uridine kinase [Crocinitomicaceae bacterium]|tara:strand:+ start:42815 stop:43417 length:603 start_codon:yes stop_codon:yes gene_type:complete
MIIGICGGSGSGKTTLLKRLCSHFIESRPSVFSMDNYYFPIQDQIKDENGVYNFDLPTALDEVRLVKDLTKLKAKNEVIVSEYNFNTPQKKNRLVTIKPSDLIIVEGLFLFHYEGVNNQLDYTIFINVDAQTQLERRLNRDQKSRGYTRESILYQWENHVAPCYAKYILPYKKRADFEFRNDSNADNDFNLLIKEIENKI